MNAVWNFVQGAWKAVVAAATPLVVAAFNDALQDAQSIGAAAATALAVYLVPNKG